jgi:hypothetical protein
MEKSHEENCFQPLSEGRLAYVIKVISFCCKLLEQELNIPTCKSTKERDGTSMVKISTSIAEHVHLKTWDFTRQQAWKGAPFATWRKSKDNACCDNHTQVQKTGGKKKIKVIFSM